MSDAPAPTLEERVTALEAAMWPLQVAWTPDQVAEAEADLRQKLGDGAWKHHEIRFLPPAPILTLEKARALLSECVTVVQPGETLVIRVPDTWTFQQVGEYQRYADAASEAGRFGFPVLVVIGEELAVAKPGAADGSEAKPAEPAP